MSAPEPIVHITHLMSAFPSWWALCGGWAVDAWIGRQTREHADVDIAMAGDDMQVLFDYLADWELVAHDQRVADDSAESWDGRELELPAHIHGREWVANGQRLDRLIAPAEAGFNLDIQLTERSKDEVLVSRDPRISFPLARYVGAAAWSVPVLAPEVILFYKAGESRLYDEADFAALLPFMTPPQRDWLRLAIERAHPEHSWLRRLG